MSKLKSLKEDAYIAQIGDEMSQRKVHSLAYYAMYVIFYNIRNKVAKLICKVVGHNWVDNSYGCPDYGYHSEHCTRCWQYNYQHVY